MYQDILYQDDPREKIYTKDRYDGGRFPYCVCKDSLEGKDILKIYKEKDDGEHILVLTCYYEQLILPFSDINVRNYTVGGSVLINLKDNEYILVCENIFYFSKSKDLCHSHNIIIHMI